MFSVRQTWAQAWTFVCRHKGYARFVCTCVFFIQHILKAVKNEEKAHRDIIWKFILFSNIVERQFFFFEERVWGWITIKPLLTMVDWRGRPRHHLQTIFSISQGVLGKWPKIQGFEPLRQDILNLPLINAQDITEFYFCTSSNDSDSIDFLFFGFTVRVHRAMVFRKLEAQTMFLNGIFPAISNYDVTIDNGYKTGYTTWL